MIRERPAVGEPHGLDIPERVKMKPCQPAVTGRSRVQNPFIGVRFPAGGPFYLFRIYRDFGISFITEAVNIVANIIIIVLSITMNGMAEI